MNRLELSGRRIRPTAAELRDHRTGDASRSASETPITSLAGPRLLGPALCAGGALPGLLLALGGCRPQHPVEPKGPVRRWAPAAPRHPDWAFRAGGSSPACLESGTAAPPWVERLGGAHPPRTRQRGAAPRPPSGRSQLRAPRRAGVLRPTSVSLQRCPRACLRAPGPGLEHSVGRTDSAPQRARAPEGRCRAPSLQESVRLSVECGLKAHLPGF